MMALMLMGAALGLAGVAVLTWHRPAAGIAVAVLAVVAPLGAADNGAQTAKLADAVALVATATVFARTWLVGRATVDRRLVGLLAACVAASALAVFLSADPQEGLGGLARFLQVFVVLPLGAYLAIRDVRDGWLVLGSLLAAGVAEALLGVFQYATASGAGFGRDAVRAVGTFGAYNVMSLAGLLSTSILIALGLALARGAPRQLRAIGAVALIPLTLGLLASLSRGAWLGVLVAALLVGCLADLRRTLAVVLVCVAGQLSSCRSSPPTASSRSAFPASSRRGLSRTGR